MATYPQYPTEDKQASPVSGRLANRGAGAALVDGGGGK